MPSTTSQFRRDLDQLAALLYSCCGIIDKLINNLLGVLLLVTHGGSLAHQEGAELVHQLVDVDLLRGRRTTDIQARRRLLHVAAHEAVQVGLVRQNALGGKLPDLLLSLRLPVDNVGVLAHTQRTAGEDERAHGVVKAGGADGFLVALGRAGLLGEHEARADPHGGGAHHQGSGEQVAVVDAAGGDDLHGLLGQGRSVALDGLDDGGDQNGRGDVTGVATAFTTLGADDIDAQLEALLDVLGVANHVHVQDAVLVQALDDVSGRHTDGRDKQRDLLFNDDINQLVQLALGVVVVGLAGVAADLGQQQVDAKRRGLVVQIRLELGNLVAQHVGRVVDAANDAQAAGIGDGSGELGTGSHVHACEQHGVVDLEQIGGGGADFLWQSLQR